MKVTKVNTSSFAISKDTERRIKSMAESESKKSDSKVTLQGRYAPVAKFKLVKREKVASGSVKFLAMKKTVYSEDRNLFYVNMNNAKLIHISGKNRHGVELSEIDFFERLLNLPTKAVSMLGHLIEYGSTDRKELESDALDELLIQELAEEYVYERNLFVGYMLREIGDFTGSIPPLSRKLIRPTYKIPHFGDSSYDLGRFLEVDDTVEASFSKDGIKYAEEEIRGILSMLFKCKAELVEIVYVPYYEYSILAKGVVERHNYLLACPRRKAKFSYQHPLKLRTISLYSMEVGSKVISIEADVITFDDVGNLKNAKEEINRKVTNPIKTASLTGEPVNYTPGGILFYGPPGCGKTYLAKATVGEIGIAFISGNIENIMNEGADMAAKKLHDVFEYARNAAPCVLFFDEIDSIASRRDVYGGNPIVNQLLTEMDGILGMTKNVLIIGATNMPWRLDPALIRGGRFSEQVYIRPPDFESRIEMFDIYLKKQSDIAPGVSARELASLTEHYSAADIKTVVDRAAVYALESSYKGKKHRIQQWHLIQAIRERKSSLIPWYKYAEKQMEVEGAKEAYADLWEDIQDFNSDIKKIKEENLSEAGDLEKLIESWRKSD